MTKINIALVTDENYALMTAMCINDIILNKKSKTILNFYILLNNVSDIQKNTINSLSKDDVNISFIDITNKCQVFEEEYKKINSKRNDSYHVSGTAFMRCFLPEILKDLDKILYLDQDIYVNGDLHKFYDINIKDYLLAAPIDTFAMLSGKNNPSYNFCQKSFDNHVYIQDGQILMNLKKMREFNFCNKCIKFLKENLPPNKDMDVINAVAYGLIKCLSQEFCVPRAAIELAKNGYVHPCFLDIRYYNVFIDTGYKTFENFINNGLIWHFYGDKNRDMQLSSELKKIFIETKSRLQKTLNPNINQNTKSFLILHEELALGDTLAVTNFFKDFHEQYPNFKIYYKVVSDHPYWTSQKEQIFKNNPNVKIWNGEYVDKVIKYKNEDYFNKSNKEKYVMNHCIYDVFEKNTGIKVNQNTMEIDVYPTKDELDGVLNKFNIDNNKPICLICDGYHPISNTVKYAGFNKFQNIVNSLNDSITFIQVGDTKGGYIQNKLNGVIDLIDKTNIRDMIALVYHSSFVITGLHALLHLASIKSKCTKDVYVFYGCRECSDWYLTYLNLDHTKFHLYGNDLEKYQKCLHGDWCCLKDITVQNEQNKNRKFCNSIKMVGNEAIAECMNNIDENEIINDIKVRLHQDEKYNIKQNGKLKIAMIQYDNRINDVNIKSILDFDKKYCELNGYDYIFKIMNDDDFNNSEFNQYLFNTSDYYKQRINIYYYKFCIIEQYINDYDYLIYCDTDLIINNPNIKIEDLIDDKHDIFMFKDQGEFATTVYTLHAANAISNYCKQNQIPYLQNPYEDLQKIKVFSESAYESLCKVIINPIGLNAGFMIINCHSKILKDFINDFKKFYPLFAIGFFDQGCIATLLRRNKYKDMLKILPTFLCGNPFQNILNTYALDHEKAFLCHFYGSKPSNEEFYNHIEKIKNNKFWSSINEKI